MTGKQRREQLLDIGRRLFAERGFEGTSIEEIAARAGVSKPVVYEHFGGKEGLYAWWWTARSSDCWPWPARSWAASTPGRSSRRRRSPCSSTSRTTPTASASWSATRTPASGAGTFGSLINDIASQVEYILSDFFAARGYDPKLVPMYAQMLVGMVAMTGQWWLDARKPKMEEVAAHLINLAWNGLSQLETKPRISSDVVRRARS